MSPSVSPHVLQRLDLLLFHLTFNGLKISIEHIDCGMNYSMTDSFQYLKFNVHHL